MIDITKLIALHHDYSPAQALPGSLGDGYLYTLNKVFANVRDVVRASGFSFSDRHTSLWREYNVFPLLCLQSILEGRVVPFCDNVSPLRAVVSRSASLALPPNFLLGNLRRNYLLHESAHCLAYDVLLQIDGQVSHGDKKTVVLDNLFAESFANATETFAASFLETTAAKFFFNLSSFMSYIPAVNEAARRLGASHGPRGLFKLLCFSYFFANLRFEEVTPELSDLCISLSLDGAGVHEDDEEPLAVLLDNSLKLNEKFRAETAAVYFSFLGCQEEFKAVYRVNLADDSPRLSRYLDALNVLTDQVVSGISLPEDAAVDITSVHRADNVLHHRPCFAES